jgi:hypothetical protein
VLLRGSCHPILRGANPKIHARPFLANPFLAYSGANAFGGGEARIGSSRFSEEGVTYRIPMCLPENEARRYDTALPEPQRG